MLIDFMRLVARRRARIEGARWRFQRNRSGLSLRAVAAEIGVSPATLSRYERGDWPEDEVGPRKVRAYWRRVA